MIHRGASLVVVAVVLFGVVGAAAGLDRVAGTPPRIESRLVDIARWPAGESSIGEARRRDMPVAGESVMVEVLPVADAAATAEAIVTLDGRVVATNGGRFLAAMPPERLLELAADPAVAFVTTPAAPVVDGIVSEGVLGQGAAGWHNAAFDGTGIGVLVVDSGFAGLQRAQARGDVPASLGGTGVGPTCSDRSLTGSEENLHGTAVAEIVHDMAPGADLYLYRTCLLWDGPDLVSFVEGHGIDVVTQSLAYFNTVPLDGRDPWGVFSAITEVVDGGVLWFNSAGNYRQRHWRGGWRGGDELDFGGNVRTIEVPLAAGEAVHLRWDDWRLDVGRFCDQCGSNMDLDLYLLGQFGATAASSTTVQSASSPGPPIETVVSPRSGTYSIQVRAKSGQTIPPWLQVDLFVPSRNLPTAFQVPAGSLGDAATLDAVIAVGAVCWQDSSIRPYSSEGPTGDGRLKPDLSAFDGVSTRSYSLATSCTDGFLGTSAAAPHAAGAAAVMMQASGARGSEARVLLGTLTVDLGPRGPDNRYGVGRLDLDVPPSGECGGVAATIIALPGQRFVLGTAGPDVIVGNRADNEISGGSGDDWICGLGGADLVNGAAGVDQIWGGRGKDLLLGGPDGDIIWGNGGADDLRGSLGDDALYGGSGDDSLLGGRGDDLLDGGRGTDRCRRGVTLLGCEV